MINKAIRMNTTQRFKDARKALADAQERASSLRHLETANACQQGIDRITELEVENYRLKKIEAAAVEYVRDSYRPEPKYDAERFDKLVATLPNGVRLEEDDD